MHRAVLYAPWRIEPPWSAAQGIRAPSCCGCWPGTRRSRSCTSPPTRTRARRSATCTRRCARPTATSVLRRYDAADLTGLDVVFVCAAARRVAAARPEICSTASRTSSTSAPTSGCRPTSTSGGTASRTPRPSSSTGSRTGSSSCTATQLAHADHVAVPGCYPTAVSLALAPLVAIELVEPRGIIANAVSGVSGAGRGAEDDEPVLGSERERLGVRIAHASPHRRDGAGAVAGRAARRSRCCSRRTSCRRRAASSRRVTRGRRRPGLSTARLLEHYREFYADDPCVVVVDEPSGTKATYGANVVHVTVRFDVRTETVLAIAAEDNLVKGASGQMIQAANLVLGLPETTGLPLARESDRRERASQPSSVERRRSAGFVAGGLGVRHQGVGCARSRDRRDRGPRAGRRGRACSRRTSRRPRRCRSARGISPTVARPRSCSTPGNANAATGEPGRTRRAAHVRAHRRRARRRGRPTCSSARPVSSASRCRWHALEAGHPEAVRAGVERRRRRRGAGDHDDRHRAEGSRRDRRRGDRRRNGEGCGDAVAGDGDDARRRHHRRRRRPRRRCSARWHARWRETFDCLIVDGCPFDERHRARARERARRRGRRPRVHRRAHRGVRFAGRADGTRRRRRDEVRAGAGRRCPVATPTPASPPAPSRTASSCSARSTATTRTGVACSRSSARAARSSIPSGSTSPTTASPSAATASRARTTRPRSPQAMAGARHRDPLRPPPRARRGDGAHDRPVARVHRREPAHVVTELGSTHRERVRDAGREGARSSPRRCRTSASSRAAPSSSSTAATRWRTPSSPICSRPTSC